MPSPRRCLAGLCCPDMRRRPSPLERTHPRANTHRRDAKYGAAQRHLGYDYRRTPTVRTVVPRRQNVSPPVDLEPHDRTAASDLRLARDVRCARLRRLLRTTIGLSQESVDLLTSMADRLRAAEGALPDPAYY